MGDLFPAIRQYRINPGLTAVNVSGLSCRNNGFMVNHTGKYRYSTMELRATIKANMVADARNAPPPEAEVSALLKANSGLVHWSPCGEYVAVASGNRLAIRERQQLQIVQQYSTVDAIQVQRLLNRWK